MTIIEFGDIACPFCARAAPYLRALRRRYPDAVSIIYRHYPLHPHSLMGAVALECASNAGTFDAMYRDLIASDSLGLKSWTAFAAEAGVSDIAAFERCMADTGTLGAVVKDRLAAKRLGAPGTPTFIVNGLMIPGFSGSQEMDRYIYPLLQASPVQNHRQ